MRLIKGQKVDLTKGRSVNKLELKFGWMTADARIGIDAAAFLLSDRNRCERDENFIFYGNPVSIGEAVSHSVLQQGVDKEAIVITLSGLPVDITRIALTLTIYEGEQSGHSMKQVSAPYLRLVDGDSDEELFIFDYGSDLSKETAIVVGELYRYGSGWKFSAIGSGFDGGLAALCTNYGLDIEEAEGSNEVAATPELTIPLVPILSEEKNVLSNIDLRKKIVQITLEKKKLTGVTARVGIVLDITGSMRNLYANGTVQEVVERILAVACKFDDNQSLDVWVYDTEFSRLPPVTEQELGSYVFTHIMNNNTIHKFGRNNEPPVMEDIIKKYTEEEPDSTPVFIIFINDGGVVKPTKKVIMAASVQPIFWQFVGIGNSDFEVLMQLDTMKGRLVDNANFIHLDRIEQVTDEELYDQLLNEFPIWLKAAKEKRIIRA